MNAGQNFSHTALLLLAFGGPRTLDEVTPFLNKLMGRRPSDRQVRECTVRYEAIGGGSPLPAITMRQASALRDVLTAEGYPVAVYVGMRYGAPSIDDAVTQMAKDETSRVVMCSLSPYRSPYTSEGYYEEAKKLSYEKGMTNVVEIEPWYTHPSLQASWARHLERVAGEAGISIMNTPVIFTAHSLPLSVGASYGYVDQLHATIEGIRTLIGPLTWHLAFQSRGRGDEQWLTPTPETILEQLRDLGHKKAVVVPLGFVTDHMETLYDLDIALWKWAQSRGLEITRVPCFNDQSYFIRTLADVVNESLGEL